MRIGKSNALQTANPRLNREFYPNVAGETALAPLSVKT
jgi:hypothetical protein